MIATGDGPVDAAKGVLMIMEVREEDNSYKDGSVKRFTASGLG